jgi:hypothetical protein
MSTQSHKAEIPIQITLDGVEVTRWVDEGLLKPTGRAQGGPAQ